MKKYNIAIVGATGAVGEELLLVLQQLNFPVNKILPLASKNSLGTSVTFANKDYAVVELTEDSFKTHQIDIAFFSAGGAISEKFAKYAVRSGALVIDNTSHFRMQENVPLVVPEVNPQDIAMWKETGIIANPNCSTIQMVQTLKPLDDLYGITRVDVATYQAVSGAGKEGMKELVTQMQDFFAFKLSDSKKEAFAHQIALNVLPQVDIPMSSGYTKEEEKMIYETRKILHKDIKLSATCVRVPVLRSHSEAVTVTFEKDTDVNIKKCQDVLKKFENMRLLDDLENSLYPMPTLATNTDDTFVGRLRKDIFDKNVLHFFNVADQIRVGAATNSVRIAMKWIKEN
ncbi:MAG: aspartate-semialdehyde dehydrogenase [Campylobacteraceae bacterium 4484_166]|nr:MAG: aspartate-semialdehyde dehydrogenase [Campylobacteraceae bacterium 4484_166]